MGGVEVTHGAPGAGGASSANGGLGGARAVYAGILEAARTRCAADGAVLMEVEGEALVNRAFVERFPDGEEERGFPDHPFRLIPRGDRGTFAPVTAVLERRAVHLPDVAALAALPDCGGYDWQWVRAIAQGTCRTWLGVPVLRDGRAVGMLGATRFGDAARPFTDAQIAALQAVADEAAAALEGVRA